MKAPRLTEDDLAIFEANLKKIKLSGDGVKKHTGWEAGGGGSVTERPATGTTVKSGARTSHPNIQTLFIPGPLPGANDIIRKHHMVYSKLKSQWGLTCARCILVAKLKRVQYCRISFLWQEKHNRRDDDNVIFGQKFVLDALRDTKIIPDDRRQFIHSLTHRVIVVPTNPGVFVTVEEV